MDKYLVTGFLILGLFWGCSAEQDESSINMQEERTQESVPDFSSVSTDNVFVYRCGDSLQITAHVTQDSSWLFLPDTTIKVLPVESGSGARFEGSSYIYWKKGNEALLQKPAGPLMSCKAIPQKRSWKAAKLRGVDFRALGQEPGWILEITEGEQIKYVGNYGEDTVRVPAVDPQKEEQRTFYQAKTEDHKLEVEVIDKRCTDSMSGFVHPYTVSITVNGETYNGCGRNLM